MSGWNVIEMEDKVISLMDKANYLEHGLGDVVKTIASGIPEEKRKVYLAAVKEMADIMYRKDNITGYHLNCVHSGITKYRVFRDFPEYEGQDMLVGTYDSEEDAEKDMTENTSIIDYDPEELWAILDKNNKNVTGMIYPTKIRATAFLYHIAEPKAFAEYDRVFHHENK